MSRKPARVFLIPKGIALAACALLAAAAIFGVVHVPAAITAATAARQLPIYSVDRPAEDGKKYCAISFDAAWGNEDTKFSSISCISTRSRPPSSWWGIGWINIPSPSRRCMRQVWRS